MTNFPLAFLFTILALVAVLILAWLSIRMLARYSTTNVRGGSIQVTHTLPIGTREKLMLVNLNDNTYFLGITANGITIIDKNPVTKDELTVSSTPQAIKMS